MHGLCNINRRDGTGLPLQRQGSRRQKGPRGLRQPGKGGADPCQDERFPPFSRGACLQPAHNRTSMHLHYTVRRVGSEAGGLLRIRQMTVRPRLVQVILAAIQALSLHAAAQLGSQQLESDPVGRGRGGTWVQETKKGSRMQLQGTAGRSAGRGCKSLHGLVTANQHCLLSLLPIPPLLIPSCQVPICPSCGRPWPFSQKHS